MTELYALVAIGEFDISQFLAGGGDLRPAAKYVDHLRGRRTLHDEAIKALDDQIVRFANIMWFDNVLTRDQDVPAEVKVGDHYKTVMQVAAEFQPGLLRPDTWCLLNGHIVKAWAHRTPKARSRYQMSGWWPELLRYEANARGMQNVCRCHVIQTLYEQGNPGPPNEQSLFGRGGRRRTRRNSPITRTHDR